LNENTFKNTVNFSYITSRDIIPFKPVVDSTTCQRDDFVIRACRMADHKSRQNG